MSFLSPESPSCPAAGSTAAISKAIWYAWMDAECRFPSHNPESMNEIRGGNSPCSWGSLEFQWLEGKRISYLQGSSQQGISQSN